MNNIEQQLNKRTPLNHTELHHLKSCYWWYIKGICDAHQYTATTRRKAFQLLDGWYSSHKKRLARCLK